MPSSQVSSVEYVQDTPGQEKRKKKIMLALLEKVNSNKSMKKCVLTAVCL